LEVQANDERIQKLDQVIKKGDAFATQLERQGLDLTPVKGKLDSAKLCFESGEHSKAFTLIQEFIGDLNRLKESYSKEKASPSKKGKGVFALIRDSSQMEQRISEWKVIIGEWREKGYDFEADDSLFSYPFDEVEKRFISIGEQIEKAETIRDVLKGLRHEFSEVGKVYRSKIDDIERSVFRLDRLDDLERRVNQLRGLLKSVDTRYKSLRNRLSRYRRKGLATNSLEEMLENDDDLDYLEKQFNIYEGNIEFLSKEKQKFQTFKQSATSDLFASAVREIEKMIDDPWMLDSVVEKMIALEKGVNQQNELRKRKVEETQRRSEIKENLRRYRAEGFRVEMVEQLLDEDMNLLEEEYDIFVRNLARLKTLKEKLFTMDATGFEEEVASIFNGMNDPLVIDNIEHQIEDLKERIKQHRLRKQKVDSAIKRWSGMGYSVSKLEDLASKDLLEAEKLSSEYESRISKMMDIEAKLQGINLKEINDIVHKLLLKIKNPELYDSVMKDYTFIESKIEDYESIKEKRKELNDLLKVWKGQGYRIDTILSQMKEAKTIRDLNDIILRYTRSIATLETFRKEFQTEIRGWFRDEETLIEDNLGDPDRVQDVIAAFETLREKNQKEEQRRGVIARKLDEIDSKGIDTSGIRPHLTGETDVLNSEYDLFKEQVKRLIKLKADLLREAYKYKGDKQKQERLKDLASTFTDPYRIESYEEEVTGKPKTVKGDKEGNFDIDSLMELARNTYKNGKLLESLGFYESILTLDPENKEGSFYKKKILMRLKQKSGQTDEPAPEPDGVAAQTKKSPPDKKDARTEHPQAPAARKGDPNCISCAGTGECSWCKGVGKCSTCNGTGKYFGDTCTTCKGSGRCNVCEGTGKCSWCSM